LDLLNEDSIAAAAAEICGQADSLQLVVNSSGILYSGDKGGPERRLAHLEESHLIESFRTHVAGPLLVAKHLEPLLRGSKDEPCVYANISAKVGSIGDNRLGGWYSYRSTKAGLNMATKTLSIEFAKRHVCCLALHPGTVETDFSRNFHKNVKKDKLFPPDRAARQLLAIMEGATMEDNGKFRSWDGSTLPW